MFHYSSLNIPQPTYDNYIEQQGITLKADQNEINIINVYIPPQSCCEPQYEASICHLLEFEDSLILGDINAHSNLWHSEVEESTRGRKIEEEILDSNSRVLNDNGPTRLINNNRRSLDVTIASNSIINGIYWEIQITLGSDHPPLIITLNQIVLKSVTERRGFINYNKADWSSFTSYTEQ